MEEYLQNMKCLRSQMIDIEDDATKRSVEEQKQRTAIDALDKDLLLVRSESKRLQVESEEMAKEKAQIACQILEKQKKIASLETDSSTLSQTLELLQQEMICASEKFDVKRSYYKKVEEELSARLQERQDWFESYKGKMVTEIQSGEGIDGKHVDHIDGSESSGVLPLEMDLEDMGDEVSVRYKELMVQLDSAKSKVEDLETKKSRLSEESNRAKQLLEKWQQKFEGFPPSLKAMDLKALLEEQKALLADKAGEMEYLQSLQDQINQIKGISHDVKCQCGKEYKVEMVA